MTQSNNIQTNAYKQALAEFPVIHEQTVAWGEMDALAHVNNVVYYRYAENARITYLHELGMFEKSMVLMLAQSTCTYLRPVFYPDTLHIGVRIKKLGNTSMVFEYCFFSLEQQAVVSKAETVIVQMNKDATDKKAWTPEQREQILALENTVGHLPES